MNDQQDKNRHIDGVIERARSKGESTQKGQFTIDRGVAREKLRKFQLEDPWSYPIELVQAAALLGAERIDIETRPEKLKMRFDGRPLTREDFEQLYGAIFLDDRDSRLQARSQLALGINAAQALATKRIRIVSGADGVCAAMTIIPGQDDEIDTSKESAEGTLIEIEYARQPGKSVSRDDGAKRSARFIRERCQYSKLDIYLNQEKISFGLTLPSAVATVEIEDERAQGVAGVEPRCPDAEVRLVVDGVHIDTHKLKGLPPGLVAVVEDPRLIKDLAHGAVVRDKNFDHAVHEAEKACSRALHLVSNDRSEIYLFQPNTSEGFGSDVAPSTLSLPELFVSRNRPFSGRLYYRTKRLMKLFVKALYLSPLLLVPKLVLWLLDSRAGDVLTMFFVVLVVGFFLLLDVLLALYMIVGPKSRRRQFLDLHLDNHTLDNALKASGMKRVAVTTKQQLSELLQSENLRIKGRVIGQTREEEGIRHDRAVLRNNWFGNGRYAARTITGKTFLVEPDDAPSGMKVMVDVGAGPWVIGRHEQSMGKPALGIDEHSKFSKWLSRKTANTLSLEKIAAEGRGVQLEEGDEVEIVANGGTWELTKASKLGADKQHLVGDAKSSDILFLSSKDKNPLLIRIPEKG
ncbi:MAG: hypothetical protein GY854_19495 [Deltaproteobacteria bacterium]|nr:hypothetical protein [Deltaproteobacteria bacterium]